MKHKLFTVGLLVALTILAGGWACSTTNLQKAATINKDFATAEVAAQQAEIAFHKPCTAPSVPYGCGTIDDSEHAMLQRDFLTLATCGKAVDAGLTAGDKAGTTKAITTCSNALASAINQGAAGIKNPNTQASVTGLLLTAQTILTSSLAWVQ